MVHQTDRRRNPWVAFALLASMTPAVDALQNRAAAFEVVSIRLKAVSPDTPEVIASFQRDRLTISGNRLQAADVSALALIRAAYNLYPEQVDGAEAWVESERFAFDARAVSALSPSTATGLAEDVAAMLRRVLEERFQLRMRMETRPIPGYVLTYAHADRSLKPGLRMSDQDCTGVLAGTTDKCVNRLEFGMTLTMRGQPIDLFVRFLTGSARAGKPVVNETGIAGNIDLDLKWPAGADLTEHQANVFRAIQEQLGLKLESRRLPLPVLVIEHIERPSAN